jgi:wyosine [tRNA(Phe)-imidazoG37] synthetase (radical SAM superfamily)
MKSIIYGPVLSWRLGRSLGIDIISARGKTCSFDCTYCEWGATVHPLTERKEFVTLAELRKELETAKGVATDYATFAGGGEPTLAGNLGQAIEIVKSTLKLPVAVITNSSLMPREDVRRELARADLVIAKIDAPNEEIFHAVNRPFKGYTLAEIIQGIGRFREGYKGRLALQMMFIEANKGCAQEMAGIAGELSPDEVQINTPLRPCAVMPLSPKEIAAIRGKFSGFKKVVTVYEVASPT